MKRKKNLLTLVLGLSLVLTACGQDNTKASMAGLSNVKAGEKLAEDEKAILVKGDNYPLTIRDFIGQETILKKPFERPAVLSGTPLNIWYDLGGKSICTSDVSDNVRLIPEYEEEIRGLDSIGPVYSINMEAVVEKNPDFIIAQVGTQSTEAKKLRDMGFDVVTTHIRGYDDVIDSYEAFGKILGQEELAKEKIDVISKKKETLESKAPEDGDSVVILYISGKTLAAKLDNSIAGDVAKILKLKNIASDLPPDTIGSEHTPLDIEYIVKKNPKHVLVTSMVSDNETAKKVMEEEFEKNPVWKGVDAIKNGNVVYLPQEYFLFNAGPYYPDAIEYMGRAIYPEIYGKLEEGK